MAGFLSRVEIEALLSIGDRATWTGERDYVLLSLAYNTGATGMYDARDDLQPFVPVEACSELGPTRDGE